MPPKVVVSIPKSLQTTASERARLKSAFKTKIKSVVKPHSDEENTVTNVGRVVTEVIVVDAAASKRKSKRKAGMKK
ncbi:MAG: hypothetical protein DMF72_11545 [Acidobacteria bacterium]|nr:MAG: hypothetical protein DMF72_11545 [Acidobacteriota bacterium]